MSHFAEIDDDGTVLRVIVIEPEKIATGRWGDPSRWVQTSYNTHAGVHRLGGTPMRKNYAGIGYKYDSLRDAFIPPKPSDTAVLDETTCQWVEVVTEAPTGNARVG